MYKRGERAGSQSGPRSVEQGWLSDQRGYHRRHRKGMTLTFNYGEIQAWPGPLTDMILCSMLYVLALQAYSGASI